MAEDPREESRRAEAEQRTVRDNLLRIFLTSEARQRLTNVRFVKPEVANAIENHVIQLATTGKLKRAVTDDEVKKLLATLQQPKRNFRIRWA